MGYCSFEEPGSEGTGAGGHSSIQCVGGLCLELQILSQGSAELSRGCGDEAREEARDSQTGQEG